MSASADTHYSCNGRPADPASLAAALVNYGHFTSLQARASAVQGLDLHLERLRHGTQALFGSALDGAQVQDWMMQALDAAGRVDASMRVSVFSRHFDFRDPLAAVPVDVLVAVSAPVELRQPRAVCSVRYQRELPALKHAGTFGLFQQRREAMAAGFDDALFLGPDDRVSEGTTWNLALHDGRALVWPQAAALRGTAEALLRQHWHGPQDVRPVPAVELDTAQAAFACNASGIWPLSAIDGRALPGSAALAEQGRAVLAQVPWQPLHRYCNQIR